MNRSIIVISILLTSIFFACSDDKEELPVLHISSENMAEASQPFNKEAGARTIAVSTNLEVIKVASSEKWCKVTILKENNETALYISVFPNDGFEERTAEVSLLGKGVAEIKIPIIQWANSPGIVVLPGNDVLIVDEDLEFVLDITANFDFTIERPEWIKDNGDNTSAIGHKEYKFVADGMQPGEREGEIKILPVEQGLDEYVKTIKVKQTQKELLPTLTTFSPAKAAKGMEIVLSGENFGNLSEIVKVYFNTLEATVKSLTNNAITVTVPRAPGDQCDISVVFAENDPLVYPDKFDYEKSWTLETITKSGNTTFKGGTLAEAQVEARYLSVDANNNIFASHRERAADRYLVRINEAENIVEPLSTNNQWNPNASTIGPDGVIFSIDDGNNGTVYYSLDPKDNWTPVKHTITYPDGNPISASYTYRLTYNPKDGNLYGQIGNSSGQMIKVDPVTDTGEVVYEWGSNPTWYAGTIDNNNTFYIMCNTQALGYGPWKMDLTNISAGFTRMNPEGNPGAADASTLKDGPLVTAGFGNAYEMTLDDKGNIYVSDNPNHIIRKINLTDQTVETIMGVARSAGFIDGGKDEARLNNPRGIAWNNDYTVLYISDWGNKCIRKMFMD